MNKYWGVLIPGLSMAADEFTVNSGVMVLENPEVGSGITIEGEYSLEDVARIHLETLKPVFQGKTDFTFFGFSMGGMILSILASQYRSELPENSKFVFLATSANTKEVPAIPGALLAEWSKAKPGDFDDFNKILTPFFSKGFSEARRKVVDTYVDDRRLGKNGQTAAGYIKQVSALRAFAGADYFSKLNSSECEFIGCEQDYILGPDHNTVLKDLVPGSEHHSIENMGHMVNLEWSSYESVNSLPQNLTKLFDMGGDLNA